MTEVGRWNVRVLIIVKGSNLGVEIGTPLVERCLVNTLLKSPQLSVALFPFSPIYSSRGFVTLDSPRLMPRVRELNLMHAAPTMGVWAIHTPKDAPNFAPRHRNMENAIDFVAPYSSNWEGKEGSEIKFSRNKSGSSGSTLMTHRIPINRPSPRRNRVQRTHTNAYSRRLNTCPEKCCHRSTRWTLWPISKSPPPKSLQDIYIYTYVLYFRNYY